MKQGKSGSIAVKVTSYNRGSATVTLYWTEYYDVLRNVTVIHVTKITVQHDRFAGEIYVNLTFYINGQQALKLSGNQYKGISPGVDSPGDVSGNYPYTSFEIPHDAMTGKKDVELKVVVDNCFSNAAGWQGDYNKSASSAVALTAIPRATTVAATDANVGAVSMLAVNRKSASYTHSIQYQFGSLSGYITADGFTSAYEDKLTATNIGFTVPDSFYVELSSATAKPCTLYTRTYSGATQIGDTQVSKFTVRVPESENAPRVTGSVYDSNQATTALTGDANTLVRFFSVAECSISATAQNGATIASRQINGQDVPNGSLTVHGVESGEFAFVATDSRGYKGTATVHKTLIPYIKLTNHARAERDDPTSGNATLTLTGDCFTGSFGWYSNSVWATYRVDDAPKQSAAVSVGDSSYSAVLALTGLDYRTAHTIEVTVSDQLMTVTKQITVRKGIPMFTFDENNFRLNTGLAVEGHHIHPDKDRVIAYDVNGTRRWRKWASGLAEVWYECDLGADIACTTPWGNLFETDKYGGYRYPIDFIETPSEFVTVKNCNDGVLIESFLVNTATHTGYYNLCRPNSKTIKSASLVFYAVGRYK